MKKLNFGKTINTDEAICDFCGEENKMCFIGRNIDHLIKIGEPENKEEIVEEVSICEDCVKQMSAFLSQTK